VHGTGHLTLLAAEPEGSTALLKTFIVHNAKKGDVAAQTQSAMLVLSWVHLSGQFSADGEHYRPIGVVEPASSLNKFFPDNKWNLLETGIEEAKVAYAGVWTQKNISPTAYSSQLSRTREATSPSRSSFACFSFMQQCFYMHGASVVQHHHLAACPSTAHRSPGRGN
jgi:hypothetical protein